MRASQGECGRAPDGLWGSESEEGGSAVPLAQVEARAGRRAEPPRDASGPAWRGSTQLTPVCLLRVVGNHEAPHPVF